MGMTAIDPLGDVTLWWLQIHGSTLCDCPAQADPNMLHNNACSWSKIWSDLMAARHFVSPEIIRLEFISAKNSIEHHVYTCAQCGAKRRVEDMVVVYEAPLNQAPPYNTPEFKYPHNIVKVVCCTHNRKGTIGYQREITKHGCR
jgi:hypothetical protein